MPHQVALTVRTKVVPGKVPELKALLDAMGVESQRRVLLPFERLPVHFARLFVLDDAEDLAGSTSRRRWCSLAMLTRRSAIT